MAKAKKPVTKAQTDPVDDTGKIEATADAPQSQEDTPEPAIADAMPDEAAPKDQADAARNTDDAVSEDKTAPVGEPDAPAEKSEAEDAKAVGGNDAGPWTPKPKDEPASEHPMPVPVAAEQRGGGVLAFLFAGVIVALLGFIAGRSDVIDPYLPAAMQREIPDLSALEAQSQDQAARLAALEQSVADAASTVTPQDDSAIDDLSVTIEALDRAIADASARIDSLEARPVPSVTEGDSDANQALRQELAQLQASVAEQRDEISALVETARAVEDNTEQMAQKTLARAALSRVISAVDSGKPYAPALADLSQTGQVDVPQELAGAADTGVPTLNALVERFPDAARAALAAARTAGEGQDESGLAGFLKQQLGARSVTPREGSDTDAILSRAEPALRDGRLSDALAELDALSDPARAAMSDWLSDAHARQDVQNAAETLAQRLTTN
ncbi:COG4223 family protein [Sulfitobacter sabulilitoris]|uniref:COG4223 family protein n=1 Tax=Sulfitobacter sabulilitoris TaxID=2562655 RepID=UPI001BB02B37|nr:mitofilin family membrane protein [Sulfitobacter sabulilitoris]